jgi:hypothetical protein
MSMIESSRESVPPNGNDKIWYLLLASRYIGPHTKLKTFELHVSTLVLLLESVAQDHDPPHARARCGAPARDEHAWISSLRSAVA